MHNAACVRRMHRPCNRLDEASRIKWLEFALRQSGGQSASRDKFQDEVGAARMFPSVEYLDYVWMRQGSDRFGLGAKSGQMASTSLLTRQDHLDCDVAIQLDVARPIDHSHSAAAKLALDLVSLRNQTCWGPRPLGRWTRRIIGGCVPGKPLKLNRNEFRSKAFAFLPRPIDEKIVD